MTHVLCARPRVILLLLMLVPMIATAQEAQQIAVTVSPSDQVDSTRPVPVTVKVTAPENATRLLEATIARSGTAQANVSPAGKDGVSFTPPPLDSDGTKAFQLVDAKGTVLASFDLQYASPPQPAPRAPLTTQERASVTRITDQWWFQLLIFLVFSAVVLPFAVAIGTSIYRGNSEYSSQSLPLGLPIGSIRSMMAFTFVVYIGFYVLVSVLSGVDMRPPEFLLGIVATVIGFYFASRSDDVEGKATKTAIVRGVVTDVNGPVRGALIKFLRASDGVELYSRIADSGGRFELTGAEPAKYKVRASAPTDEGTPQETDVTLAASGDHEIAISLVPPVPSTQGVQGVVKTPDGREAAGAAVLVLQAGAEAARTQAGINGEYTVSLSGPGSFEVRASLASFGDSEAVAITVESGKIARADLTLKTS